MSYGRTSLLYICLYGCVSRTNIVLMCGVVQELNNVVLTGFFLVFRILIVCIIMYTAVFSDFSREVILVIYGLAYYVGLHTKTRAFS